MKLTALLLTVALLQVQARGFSQTITLSVKDAELKHVFAAIKQQTGFVVFFNKADIDEHRDISASVKDLPLKTFLEQIFADKNIGYRIAGTSIFLSRSIPPELPAREKPNLSAGIFYEQNITGKIVDSSGNPIEGISVRIEPSGKGTATNIDGIFQLTDVAVGKYKLTISSIGFQTIQKLITITANKSVGLGVLTLHRTAVQMEEVIVYNTGYQKVKPNEMVGSVEYINKEMLSRTPGINILDRLRNLTPSLTFDRISNGNNESPNNKLGISIRGLSTINGPADPLIVVDNFIYYGDIKNIDPNTIESVTILKDAVATSIWGMRAGNGVIVFTTKKAKKSAKAAISFSSNTSIQSKPDLSKYPIVPSRLSSQLDLERAKNGMAYYIDGYGGGEPIAAFWHKRKNNQLSAADSVSYMEGLANTDYRNETLSAYYQTGSIQDYTLSMSRGFEEGSLMATASYGKTMGMQKDWVERISANLNGSLNLSPKLILSQTFSFSNSRFKSGAPGFGSAGIMGEYSGKIIPHARFFEDDGTPTGYGANLNKAFVDTVGQGLLLDWLYYPAEEYKHNYTRGASNALNLSVDLTYNLNKNLDLSARYNYQIENSLVEQVWDVQSYKARDLINTFSKSNYENNTVTFQLPVGDILQNSNQRVEANTLALTMNYKFRFNRHSIGGIGGFEQSKSITKIDPTVLVGYSEDPMMAARAVPSGYYINRLLDYPVDFLNEIFYPGLPQKKETRSISSYFNLTYAYDDVYRAYLSFRRDGANAFGVAVNDRWKPLWSVGVNANLSKYLKENRWINSLAASVTMGVSGNIDISKTAEAVAEVRQTIPYPVNAAQIRQINNPLLRWEKTTQINAKIAAGLLKGLISVDFSYFTKLCSDLYGQELFDYTNYNTRSIVANTCNMRTSGYELGVTVHAVKTKDFSVDFVLASGVIKSKITKYYTGLYDINVADKNMTKAEGASPNGVYVYKYAGLDNEGLPLFYANGEKVADQHILTADYYKNGMQSTMLRFIPSKVATINVIGSLAVSWKSLSLACGFNYAGGFYTRFTNYATLTNFLESGLLHNSYYNRWQKPGDELHTDIPRFNLTNEENNNYGTRISTLSSTDYEYKRGDHLSINTVNINWRFQIRQLITGTIGASIAGIGVIWSKEKDYRYREFPANSISPRVYSFNFNVSL